MTDKYNKEIRNKMMRAIKSKRTRLENLIAKELYKRGVRCRRNVQCLLGKPDFSIKKYKIVIFIDSCFWHGCKEHYRASKSNEKFWESKITKNIQRDLEVTQYYTDLGWNILRIWEHELKQDFEKTINKTLEFINSSKLD